MSALANVCKPILESLHSHHHIFSVKCPNTTFLFLFLSYAALLSFFSHFNHRLSGKGPERSWPFLIPVCFSLCQLPDGNNRGRYLLISHPTRTDDGGGGTSMLCPLGRIHLSCPPPIHAIRGQGLIAVKPFLTRAFHI